MKRIDRAIAAVLAVSAWAGIVLVVVPGRASLVGHVWLVVVLAIALGVVVGALLRAAPRGPSAFDAAFAPAKRRRARPESLAHMEREVALAAGTAFDVHYRLRPTLRSLAAGLLLRKGIDLDRAPERAELRRRAGGLGARPPRPPSPGRSRRARAAGRVAGARRGRPGRPRVQLSELAARGAAVLDEVERAVVGKRDRLELVLAGLLADGHVLLEDVPGLAKTLTARSFATVTGMRFARVQFTPDLLPDAT